MPLLLPGFSKVDTLRANQTKAPHFHIGLSGEQSSAGSGVTPPCRHEQRAFPPSATTSQESAATEGSPARVYSLKV